MTAPWPRARNFDMKTQEGMETDKKRKKWRGRKKMGRSERERKRRRGGGRKKKRRRRRKGGRTEEYKEDEEEEEKDRMSKFSRVNFSVAVPKVPTVNL